MPKGKNKKSESALPQIRVEIKHRKDAESSDVVTRVSEQSTASNSYDSQDLHDISYSEHKSKDSCTRGDCLYHVSAKPLTSSMYVKATAASHFNHHGKLSKQNKCAVDESNDKTLDVPRKRAVSAEELSHKWHYSSADQENLSFESVQLVESYLECHHSFADPSVPKLECGSNSKSEVNVTRRSKQRVPAAKQRGGQGVYLDSKLPAPMKYQLPPQLVPSSDKGNELTSSPERFPAAESNVLGLNFYRPCTPFNKEVNQDSEFLLHVVGSAVWKSPRVGSNSVVTGSSKDSNDKDYELASQSSISPACRHLSIHIPTSARYNANDSNLPVINTAHEKKRNLSVTRVKSPSVQTTESHTDGCESTTESSVNHFPEGYKNQDPCKLRVGVVVPKLKVNWRKAQKKQQHRLRSYFTPKDCRMTRIDEDVDRSESPLSLLLKYSDRSSS
eukprot:CAMPEP_0185034912 /NCGR_PEP_ID=MMETSP1103-20130426/25340_1 /TAXON_ID=36769 /ORGANISM="Paraphysomonas bandaiensis, Strain Caron Lab Isolate" /LENGTH=444 /DNA_ID=CAMNT_0027571757 /DNA_START=53 /DNA_END=1387 /DNA_ORIENTATION=-